MNAIVVLPTYNERENIKKLIDEIRHIEPDIHILVVDDNSPDKTADIVENLAKGSPEIHLIRRKDKRGRGLAGIAGFKYALKEGFDYVIEMDADFSHPAEYIPLFLKEIKEHDVVIGSREVEGAVLGRKNVIRNIVSKLANGYIRFILSIPIRDCTSGFRCFRKNVLTSIGLDSMVSTGPSVVEEVLYACNRHNYDIKEIPIEFADRRKGKSKLNLFKVINTFFIILRIRARKCY